MANAIPEFVSQPNVSNKKRKQVEQTLAQQLRAPTSIWQQHMQLHRDHQFSSLLLNVLFDNVSSVCNPIPFITFSNQNFFDAKDENGGAIELLKKCYNDPMIRFIAIEGKIIYDFAREAHANAIVYDKKFKELERFDPWGGKSEVASRVDTAIKRFFFDIGFDIDFEDETKYFAPIAYCPMLGPQLIEGEVPNIDLFDPLGYCQYWSIYYLSERLKNQNLSRNQVVAKIMNEKASTSIEARQFIRRYAVLSNNIQEIFATTPETEHQTLMNSIREEIKYMGLDDFNNLVSERLERTGRILRGTVSNLKHVEVKSPKRRKIVKGKKKFSMKDFVF